MRRFLVVLLISCSLLITPLLSQAYDTGAGKRLTFAYGPSLQVQNPNALQGQGAAHTKEPLQTQDAAQMQNSTQTQDAALEEIILQQHMTQMELERSLSLLKDEEKKLQTELAKLTIDLGRQASIIAAMKGRAGNVARAYYTGERISLMTLLFDAENFNDFLLMYDFFQLLYERDMTTLERYHAEREKLATLQSTKQARLKRVSELRHQFEEQLQQVLLVQAEKERNLKKLSDPATVNHLMTQLMKDWRERGLPAFHNFFSVLSTVMFQVPELATPERIQSKDLFTHTLVIPQDDFNRFLESKNDIFKQSHFSFNDGLLTVEGTYDHMNLRIVGEYEMISSKELKFHIKELSYDGFSLPQTTINEMEKTYNLGFYPGNISPNIEVTGIQLANNALTLQLKLDMPFGFGLRKN